MRSFKVMGICGSYSIKSANGNLLEMAKKLFNEDGIQMDIWGYSSSPLPIAGADGCWNDDNVLKFQEMAKSADAYILSSPEYHGTMSGVMKNQLDYLNFNLVGGKVWGLMSTLGGQSNTTTLNHMRISARWLHGHVIPEQLAIGRIKEAFNDNGDFIDGMMAERMEKLVESMKITTSKLIN